MTMTTPMLVLSMAWLLGGSAVVQAAPAADSVPDRAPVLATAWFRFHSDFDFNLYDALLTAGAARLRQQPDPLHGDCFAALVLEERSAWDAAVGYYAQTIAVTHDFSRERFVVRTKLAGFTPALNEDDRRDLMLARLFLEAGSRAYRACAWPEQDAANRRWIAEVRGRLERHGQAIAGRLEELYGVRWKRLPIEVDVVATAGWSGADTIATRAAPTHIQISSRNPGYQGAAALEMIFHEASHELVTPHNGPIAELLAAAAAEAGVGVDRNLWHALLFVTVGEVARSALEAGHEGPYTPVANDVFKGDWRPLYQPLVTHWLPVVRGLAERRRAARDLVVAIGTPSASR